jgi:hypothetical protein
MTHDDGNDNSGTVARLATEEAVVVAAEEAVLEAVAAAAAVFHLPTEQRLSHTKNIESSLSELALLQTTQ